MQHLMSPRCGFDGSLLVLQGVVEVRGVIQSPNNFLNRLCLIAKGQQMLLHQPGVFRKAYLPLRPTMRDRHVGFLDRFAKVMSQSRNIFVERLGQVALHDVVCLSQRCRPRLFGFADRVTPDLRLIDNNIFDRFDDLLRIKASAGHNFVVSGDFRASPLVNQPQQLRFKSLNKKQAKHQHHRKRQRQRGCVEGDVKVASKPIHHVLEVVVRPHSDSAKCLRDPEDGAQKAQHRCGPDQNPNQ